MTNRDSTPQKINSENSWAAAVKQYIPRRVRNHLQCLAALNSPCRIQYLRFQLRRFFGEGLSGFPPELSVRRVVFICHGNIIRSPMAEALLTRELDSRQCTVEVYSAGTDAKPGREADCRALAVAPEFGISLAHHKARRFSPDLACSDALIVVMDYMNAAKLAAQFPFVRRRLMLLPRAVGEVGSEEIRDPYTGTIEDVRTCYQILQRRIRYLAEQLAHRRARLRPGAEECAGC